MGKNQKNVDPKKCKNIKNFEEFVQSLGYDWSFYVDKDGNTFKYPDFTGPQHRKIQENICLEDMYGKENPKINVIKSLWSRFTELINKMKEDLGNDELLSFQEKTKEWVHDYYKAYTSQDVTLYMHVFANHVTDAIQRHGNLSQYSQQSFEKLNDRITNWYFQSTNHRSLEAMRQLMTTTVYY